MALNGCPRDIPAPVGALSNELFTQSRRLVTV